MKLSFISNISNTSFLTYKVQLLHGSFLAPFCTQGKKIVLMYTNKQKLFTALLKLPKTYSLYHKQQFLKLPFLISSLTFAHSQQVSLFLPNVPQISAPVESSFLFCLLSSVSNSILYIVNLAKLSAFSRVFLLVYYFH